MTLDQILRRIRRRPAVREMSLDDLDDRGRAFVRERSKGLEGWSREELEDHARRTLAGHEEELRAALADADRRRAERRRTNP